MIIYVYACEHACTLAPLLVVLLDKSKPYAVSIGRCKHALNVYIADQSHTNATTAYSLSIVSESGLTLPN